MKKTFLIPAFLVACLAACAFLVVPASADKTIGSTLKVKYKEADSDDPYGQSEFKGTVGPKKCAKGRSVTIKGYGSEKTSPNGKFAIALSGPANPGKYKVKVAEREIDDGVSCGKLKTTVTVPKSG